MREYYFSMIDKHLKLSQLLNNMNYLTKSLEARRNLRHLLAHTLTVSCHNIKHFHLIYIFLGRNLQ